MQHNPATKDKLDLLKRSLVAGDKAPPKKEPEKVSAMRHARPEATG
jgi:hypothetical protein